MNAPIPAMISIPAGRFTIGLPPCPPDAALARKWHSGVVATVDSFAFGKFPVTNAEYRAYVQAAGVDVPISLTLTGLDGDNQPVGGVSWFDATGYCEWLSALTGHTYRLPTDKEWEYAACGGKEGLQYPFGEDLTPDQACYGGRAATMPVGSYPPNGYEVYDMCGNVWEWCDDLFNEVSSGLLATNNPTGKDPDINRVLRGGSYLSTDPLNLWVAYRHEDPPDLRHECLGFRVASNTIHVFAL